MFTNSGFARRELSAKKSTKKGEKFNSNRFAVSFLIIFGLNVIMQRFSKILLEIIGAGYLCFSIITYTNCTNNSQEKEQPFEHFKQTDLKSAQLLSQKFNAQMFDCEKTDAILNKTVVLDSAQMGISERNGKYFLKAQINKCCGKKVFAMLECSRDILEKYSQLKTNHIFAAASTSRIDNLSVIAEADSIDGKTKFFKTNNSLLLTGECLAVAEIPNYSFQN